MSPLVQPIIQNYTSYRDFLRDSYCYKRSLRSGFSFRRFSAMVGLKSPNFLQLVMTGKRNLSPEVALEVARALGLNAAEKQYFLGLVKKETAKSGDEKESANKTLTSALRKIVVRFIPESRAEILTHWYYMVIRELVFLREFEPSGEWISKKLRNLISPEQAEKALGLLVRSGFLVKSKSGRLEPADPVIDTGNESYRGRILNSHLEVLKIWSKVLPLLDTDEREMGFINIPISQKKIPELKERICQFQDEIIGWLQDGKDADLVVQLGTYMIPISR